MILGPYITHMKYCPKCDLHHEPICSDVKNKKRVAEQAKRYQPAPIAKTASTKSKHR